MEQRSGPAGRLDPRTERSADALRDAVLLLAAATPSADISVTALVRAAGVSRRTFYNHASSPGELLKRVLTSELDEARDRAEHELTMSSEDLGAAVRHRLRAILEHVGRRRDVYLPGATTTVSPELYQLLSEHFLAAIQASITASHRMTPVASGFTDARHAPASVDISASYVAHAYAGAIQAWLQHPEADEVDFVLDLILGALPNWMLVRP